MKLYLVYRDLHDDDFDGYNMSDRVLGIFCSEDEARQHTMSEAMRLRIDILDEAWITIEKYENGIFENVCSLFVDDNGHLSFKKKVWFKFKHFTRIRYEFEEGYVDFPLAPEIEHVFDFGEYYMIDGEDQKRKFKLSETKNEHNEFYYEEI